MTDQTGVAAAPGSLPGTPAPDVPVFVISVAAELTGLHPQTLRTYDRLGLVTPGRSGGGGRRYSLRDLDALREVARLTAEGIGLEGVRRVLELQQEVAELHTRLSAAHSELLAAQRALTSTQNLPARLPGRTQQIMVWRRG